jgi:hypothetical protein
MEAALPARVLVWEVEFAHKGAARNAKIINLEQQACKVSRLICRLPQSAFVCWLWRACVWIGTRLVATGHSRDQDV